VAGFNNVRMALETALTMTMAMGRTFVMPSYGLSGLHDVSATQSLYHHDGNNANGLLDRIKTKRTTSSTLPITFSSNPSRPKTVLWILLALRNF
jgi:hypothetical protein